MSTLWEMAAVIRADASTGTDAVAAGESRKREAARVDLSGPGRVEYWCRLLGTTPMRLCCAIDEVGPDPTAIRRFLARPHTSPLVRFVARPA